MEVDHILEENFYVREDPAVVRQMLPIMEYVQALKREASEARSSLKEKAKEFREYERELITAKRREQKLAKKADQYLFKHLAAERGITERENRR